MHEDKPLFRPIQLRDNLSLQHIIETVMPEFGACGEGFAITDPEVKSMYENFSQDRHFYYVVEVKNKVLGGAGIAPLKGSSENICELQKMYFLEPIRGQGLGDHLLKKCLSKAKEMGFTGCYIETLEVMHAAKKLYRNNGFEKIDHAMGNTGHFGCDSHFYKDL